MLVILLIIGIYLNRSYAYFYNFLGSNRLSSPVSETEITIGNQSKNGTIKYVALGDSLTAGVGVSDIKMSYPYLIAQKFSLDENVTIINLSNAGDTSKNVLENQLPKVSSEKPNIITLLIGVNDIHNLVPLSEFENNYTQILSNLKNSKAKIFVFSIPYLGSNKIVYFPYNFILDFRTKQFNSVIKKISTNLKIEYIDLYSLNKAKNFYSSDQFHPGEEGYKEWAKSFNAN